MATINVNDIRFTWHALPEVPTNQSILAHWVFVTSFGHNDGIETASIAIQITTFTSCRRLPDSFEIGSKTKPSNFYSCALHQRYAILVTAQQSFL